MKKKVAIIGVTGSVGQEFVQSLNDHPWFEVTQIAASERSAGKKYLDAIRDANGIVAWEKPSKLKPILIQGTNDYVKTKERWSILEEFFQKNNVEYKQVFSNEGNILTKIVCLIYFFDYVSIYTASIRKIDPTPTEPIKFIKKRI